MVRDAWTLADDIRLAANDLTEVADKASRSGAYDIACGLHAVVRQLKAWREEANYAALEQDESLRSQLKFSGLVPLEPTEDVPF